MSRGKEWKGVEGKNVKGVEKGGKVRGEVQ